MPAEYVIHRTEPVFIDMGHKHFINLNNVTSFEIAEENNEVRFNLADGKRLAFQVTDCSSIAELLDNSIQYYQAVR